MDSEDVHPFSPETGFTQRRQGAEARKKAHGLQPVGFGRGRIGSCPDPGPHFLLSPGLLAGLELLARLGLLARPDLLAWPGLLAGLELLARPELLAQLVDLAL